MYLLESEIQDIQTFSSNFKAFWETAFSPENLVKMANTAITIVLIIAIGLAANYLLRKGIEKVFSHNKKRRNETLLNVFTSTTRYLVYFFMVCAILEQFGIPTTSILTVAGVGSVAIGFGAQSLVKDVINGLFILSEEQYLVGDVVEINDKTGEVEKVSLRTTTYRNLVNGEVYIVPNGEIKLVTNLTKDYQRAVVNVEIPFEPDLDTTLRILQDEMNKFDGGEDVLGQPEVQGITDFVESAMNVRIICDCKPGRAWHVERQLRRAIKYRIESEGVYIPYATRSIHLTTVSEDN